MIRITVKQTFDDDHVALAEQAGLDHGAACAMATYLSDLRLELDVNEATGKLIVLAVDGRPVLPSTAAHAAAVDQECARAKLGTARVVRAFAQGLTDEGFTTDQALRFTEIFVAGLVR